VRDSDFLVSVRDVFPRWRAPEAATELEDVPAFVELESGGPPPGACRVVGHG
jgi:hypothetical protein